MTTSRDLTASFPATSGDLVRLHARLAVAASAEGIADVAFRTFDSPIGSLLLAATEHGLVRVAFEREGHDAVLETLARDISPRVLHAPARLDRVATELEEYFSGTRRTFASSIDQQLSRGFRRTVLEHLAREVPFGNTATYAQLAALSGRPAAVRAVGTACATNPIPIVVPCHRIVRSDGTTGGYRGGPEAKIALIDLERSV